MPTFKLNHNENWKKVCLVCFEKGEASCREIVKGGVVHQSIKTYFIEQEIYAMSASLQVSAVDVENCKPKSRTEKIHQMIYLNLITLQV